MGCVIISKKTSIVPEHSHFLCTNFHSPKQKPRLEGQETKPKSSNTIQIDQNLLETRLDRLVAEKVAKLLNAMLDVCVLSN